jgi:hypothetical protein
MRIKPFLKIALLFVAIWLLAVLYLSYELKKLRIDECNHWKSQGIHGLDMFEDYKLSQCTPLGIQL